VADFELRVDDKRLRKDLRKIIAEASDGRKPLNALFTRFARVVRRQWAAVKATGGTFRGKRWPPFAPQYKRKDGTVVPAWGGVPKVRGRGLVKGRRRPSGKRVTKDSVQLQDTGTMRDSALSRPAILNREKLRIAVSGPANRYAEHVSRKRDWLRWTKDDERFFQKAVRAYWAALLRRHGAAS
jgi:hypothetical protein